MNTRIISLSLKINYTIFHDIAGMANSILLGAEYRSYDGESRLFEEIDGVKGDILQDREVGETLLGVFIQDELKPIDPLSVTFGIRYDQYDMDMTDAVTPSAGYDISDSAWSPRVGLSL